METETAYIIVVFTCTRSFCSMKSILFKSEFVSEQLISFFFTVLKKSISCEELHTLIIYVFANPIRAHNSIRVKLTLHIKRWVEKSEELYCKAQLASSRRKSVHIYELRLCSLHIFIRIYELGH